LAFWVFSSTALF